MNFLSPRLQLNKGGGSQRPICISELGVQSFGPPRLLINNHLLRRSSSQSILSPSTQLRPPLPAYRDSTLNVSSDRVALSSPISPCCRRLRSHVHSGAVWDSSNGGPPHSGSSRLLLLLQLLQRSFCFLTLILPVGFSPKRQLLGLGGTALPTAEKRTIYGTCCNSCGGRECEWHCTNKPGE